MNAYIEVEVIDSGDKPERRYATLLESELVRSSAAIPARDLRAAAHPICCWAGAR